MNTVQDTMTVAQGITDLGMMAIVASFFLVLSALLWVACFRWFKGIIDGMINGNARMVDDLLVETRKQNDMLNDISEGLRPETQLRIKNFSGVYFDLAIEKVCRIIRKVKTENHIADKEATQNKIRTLLHNLHEDRNSRFDSFRYRGKILTTYVNPDWVDWVDEVVEREVYSDNENYGRTYTNVQAVYERIKIDFYHRLNK
ncbi:MAG: hypothetical protein NC548_46375 [Lachnospiraceae bacterium]|nr:hypothetical protein [Lachnospiraceae bacterium]MCM1234841.1 hypothetical protein [Ruminococcus flavefaciens]